MCKMQKKYISALTFIVFAVASGIDSHEGFSCHNSHNC